MPSPSGVSWIANCKINGIDVTAFVSTFEWKSMVNGGYVVRCCVQDPFFQTLDQIIEEQGSDYLITGRQYDKPALMVFQLEWQGGVKSKQRVALISDIRAVGKEAFKGVFEFIAMDPISYYVNSGKASGKAYRGKLGGDSGVISQVLKEYVPSTIGSYNVKFDIGETDDQPNIYWMMRQDPRTFIASLIDWSSAFTKHKTSWVVANGQEDTTLGIEIKESYTPDLKYPANIEGDDGPYILAYGGIDSAPVASVKKWELLTNNFLSAVELKLLTSGMSAISGEYWDKVTDKDESVIFVKDENTQNKVNPSLKGDQSFAKPKKDDRGFTHIPSIPEIYSAGEIGAKYSKYIDGRARQKYLEMINMVMRMRVTARGQPRLFDSTELGRTKVKLSWLKPPEDQAGVKPRFIDGDWLLYGWHHRLTEARGWETDVYLSRLDYNAASIPGPG